MIELAENDFKTVQVLVGQMNERNEKYKKNLMKLLNRKIIISEVKKIY